VEMDLIPALKGSCKNPSVESNSNSGRQQRLQRYRNNVLLLCQQESATGSATKTKNSVNSLTPYLLKALI
jgi:hypothetical protein